MNDRLACASLFKAGNNDILYGIEEFFLFALSDRIEIVGGRTVRAQDFPPVNPLVYVMGKIASPNRPEGAGMCGMNQQADIPAPSGEAYEIHVYGSTFCKTGENSFEEFFCPLAPLHFILNHASYEINTCTVGPHLQANIY